MGRVEGKVAIITGAASGIGRASAQRLCEEGAHVVLADINAEAGQRVADEISDKGGSAEFERLDVTTEQSWQGLIEKVIAHHGQLDVLFNCAGIVQLATIENTTEELWRKIHAVGTDGTFFGCKHALEAMQAKRSGSIINMCSTASIQGMPNVFAYAASKSAIRGMTKSVACLSAQNHYGVRCNSIHPGNMETPMLEGVRETVRANNAEAAQQMQHLWVGEPTDVANVVLFLASDESKAFNGAQLVVDNTTTITEGTVPAFVE